MQGVIILVYFFETVRVNKLTSVSLKFDPLIKAYLSLFLDANVILAPSIPCFKDLGMRNL